MTSQFPNIFILLKLLFKLILFSWLLDFMILCILYFLLSSCIILCCFLHYILCYNYVFCVMYMYAGPSWRSVLDTEEATLDKESSNKIILRIFGIAEKKRIIAIHWYQKVNISVFFSALCDKLNNPLCWISVQYKHAQSWLQLRLRLGSYFPKLFDQLNWGLLQLLCNGCGYTIS